MFIEYFLCKDIFGNVNSRERSEARQSQRKINFQSLKMNVSDDDHRFAIVSRDVDQLRLLNIKSDIEFLFPGLSFRKSSPDDLQTDK